MNRCLNRSRVGCFAAYLVAIGLGSATVEVASAALVADWDLTGNTGTEATEPANATGTGITGVAITRGAGLTALNAGANGFNSDGWEDGAQASASNEYFEFGFTVQAGYSVDLAQLKIATRSSGTGPGTVGLYSNLDSYTNPLATFVQGNGTFLNSLVDLSALAPITGTFLVRLIEIGNTDANPPGTTASGGTYRIAEYQGAAGGPFENVEFSGDITPPAAVPLPAAVFVFAGVAGVAGALRRRIKNLLA
jgi:hypothetical protein